VSKDTGLNQYLPPIRAVLETILLQVRSIIVINNCADAFFMGSMKNRDLKGQEIPSQVLLSMRIVQRQINTVEGLVIEGDIYLFNQLAGNRLLLIEI
jgi:hypothetical protein